MVNLFNIAKTNGPRLKAEAEHVRAPLGPVERDCLDRFTARVGSDGRIAINMRVDVLLELVTASKYQNMYEWARERAQWSPKSADEIIQERLGSYHQPRIAFESKFEDGERFRYGALNIGGAGATHYGDFCVIVDDALPTSGMPVVYLRGDSLKSYVGPTASVDLAALERDAAPHSHRQYLAVLKHGTDMCRVPDDGWARLVCSADDYIEAIFVGDLTPATIERVRIAKSDYDLYFEFAFMDFRAKLNAGERILMNTFARLISELNTRGIMLEVVND